MQEMDKLVRPAEINRSLLCVSQNVTSMKKSHTYKSASDCHVHFGQSTLCFMFLRAVGVTYSGPVNVILMVNWNHTTHGGDLKYF